MQEGQSEEDARKCPACGGRLGLKLAKHGGFIGCSGYPDCSYMRPLQLYEPGEEPPAHGVPMTAVPLAVPSQVCFACPCWRSFCAHVWQSAASYNQVHPGNLAA